VRWDTIAFTKLRVIRLSVEQAGVSEWHASRERSLGSRTNEPTSSKASVSRLDVANRFELQNITTREWDDGQMEWDADLVLHFDDSEPLEITSLADAGAYTKRYEQVAELFNLLRETLPMGATPALDGAAKR